MKWRLDVDHQSTPGKAWTVVDGNRRHGEALSRGLDQLQEGLQATHDAERSGRGQAGAGIADLEPVRFVFAQFLHFLGSGRALDHQSGRGGIRHLHVDRRHPGLPSKLIEKKLDRPIQARLFVAGDRHRK